MNVTKSFGKDLEMDVVHDEEKDLIGMKNLFIRYRSTECIRRNWWLCGIMV